MFNVDHIYGFVIDEQIIKDKLAFLQADRDKIKKEVLKKLEILEQKETRTTGSFFYGKYLNVKTLCKE